MSDGCSEFTRPKADEFARALSKVAVSQICKTAGFEGFRGSALEALVDVMVMYIGDLGRAACFEAGLAGRTECNVFDVITALENMSVREEFSVSVRNCVVRSGIVREIKEYVRVVGEEVPFWLPVPRFPVVRTRRLIPSFTQMGEGPPRKNIPSWLPAFPDPHTYIHTPMWNERKSDPRADKIEQAKQRRKAERALLNLEQRLRYNGSAEPSASVFLGDDKREILEEVEEEKPVVDKLLRYDEKVLSTNVLTDKLMNGEAASNVLTDKRMNREGDSGNHALVLDAFAPAIEALNKGDIEDGANGTVDLPAKRLPVSLMFKTAKKFVGESVNLSLLKKGNGRTASWFGREERDDKKRRAEYILKKSMENPQELTQL